MDDPRGLSPRLHCGMGALLRFGARQRRSGILSASRERKGMSASADTTGDKPSTLTPYYFPLTPYASQALTGVCPHAVFGITPYSLLLAPSPSQGPVPTPFFPRHFSHWLSTNLTNRSKFVQIREDSWTTHGAVPTTSFSVPLVEAILFRLHGGQ